MVVRWIVKALEARCEADKRLSDAPPNRADRRGFRAETGQKKARSYRKTEGMRGDFVLAKAGAFGYGPVLRSSTVTFVKPIRLTVSESLTD